MDSDRPAHGAPTSGEARARQYWRRNLRYLAALLSIWFAVSYGAGILFANWLDQFRFFGFRVGFWFAQQGSIYVFVVLIFVYVGLMNRLDHELGFADTEDSSADAGDATASTEMGR